MYILRLFKKSAKLSSSASNVANTMNTGGSFSSWAGDSGLSGVEVCTGWERSQATDTERSGTGRGLNVVVLPIFSSSKLAFDGDTKNSASFSRRGLAGGRRRNCEGILSVADAFRFSAWGWLKDICWKIKKNR